MVGALIAHAFTYPNIKRVIAHTMKTNAKSISVLRRNSFQPAGDGEEPDTFRFERVRIP